MISSNPYKVLSLFVNYGETQTHFLNKILNELDNISEFEFYKFIFCTDEYNFKQKNIHQFIFNKQIGVDLSFQPYIFLEQNSSLIDSIDYILYNENDNFISNDNFKEFIYWNSFLEKHNKCCGFIRYEINNNGEKYILDPDKNDVNIIEINNIKFFSVHNIHSGCWILSKNQFKNNIQNNIRNIGYTLEDRASNVYKSNHYPGSNWGIEKLFPVSKYQKLLIHHMPNKYTHIKESVAGKIKIEDFI